MNLRLTKAPGIASPLHARFTPASPDWNPRLVRKTFLQTILAVVISVLAPVVAHAGSATWDLNPGSGDWNIATNWTPMTVPNGPADTATFALSNNTDVSISANTEVNGIIFTPAATNSYTITNIPVSTLIISGTGITNNSATIQNFATSVNSGGNPPAIRFTNSATAGLMTAFTNSAATVDGTGGALTLFSNSSSAGGATFTNNGSATTGAVGGVTLFSDSATAGNGTFINNGATANLAGGGQTRFFVSSIAGSGNFVNNGSTISGAIGGETDFFNSSSAGSATFTNIGGGSTTFFDTSSAGSGTFTTNGGGTGFYNSSSADSATLIANAGPNGLYSSTNFYDNSTGGTSRIGVFGRAYLDISSHNAPGVTIGSIDGDEGGFVFLGANTLTVGSNNLSSTFSGGIEDFGLGGSLTKIGSRTLILSGANTYTGNTNVNRGVLQVDGFITSDTFVNPRGALSGSGIVNGNVSNNYAAKVSPGEGMGVPGVLTVANNYTQAPGATLLIQIAGADAGQVSVLNVLGNANLNGYLDPVLVNGFVPEIGQSFTFMNYASFTGFFSHIKDQPFDNGRKRWLLVYYPASSVLFVVKNGPL